MMNRSAAPFLSCVFAALFLAEQSSFSSAFSPMSPKNNNFISGQVLSTTRLYFHVINGGGLADPRDWPDDDAEDLEEDKGDYCHHHEGNTVSETQPGSSHSNPQECSSLEDEEDDGATATTTCAFSMEEEMELMIGSRERDLINNSFQACMDMTSAPSHPAESGRGTTTTTIDLVEEDAWQ